VAREVCDEPGAEESICGIVETEMTVATLTIAEKDLVQAAFSLGPSALIESGMSAEDVKSFLERPDVKRELQILVHEYEHQDALNALTRFTARRRLARLSQRAIDVLEQSLRGPEYVRVGNGVMLDLQGRPILRNPEPTSNQQRAATEILDRLDVKKVEAATITNPEAMFQQDSARQIDVVSDPAHVTEEQRTMSREKVRKVIETLSKNMTTHLTEAQKLLSGKSRKTPRKQDAPESPAKG
jgi:hypothetical protein